MIEPNYGYCVILSEPQKLGRGIIAAPTVESSNIGTVLAIKTHDGVKTIFSKNDRVLYDKYSATNVELDGQLLRVLKIEHVLGIITEPDKPDSEIDHKVHLDRETDIVRNKYRGGPNPADKWRR